MRVEALIVELESGAGIHGTLRSQWGNSPVDGQCAYASVGSQFRRVRCWVGAYGEVEVNFRSYRRLRRRLRCVRKGHAWERRPGTPPQDLCLRCGKVRHASG